MRMNSFFATLAALAGLAVTPALASPTLGMFDMDADIGASGYESQCGASSPAVCGTMTLSQASTDEMQVSLSLTPSITFAFTGGPHVPVEFEITGVTIGDVSLVLPSGWTDTQSGSTFELFCSTCGGGTSGKLTSLTFDVNDTAGLENMNIVMEDLDLGGPNCISSQGTCNTGEVPISSDPCVPGTVCTQGSPTPIPEPMTVALFGAGLAGIGALVRRRKAKKA